MDDFKLRPVVEEDRPLLQQWIAEDEDHKGTTTPDFWLSGDSLSHVYEDGKGPVLFVKMSKILRLDIQFDCRAKMRNARMILKGFPALAENAKQAGFREIVFCSKSSGLTGFLKRTFGFGHEKDEFRVIL
jgi:hypothetical protein